MAKKIILSVLAFFILAAGVVAGVLLVQRNQDIREKAAPATTLSFSPLTQTKSPNQTATFNVSMNTGENLVTGLDIEIIFDPTILKVDQVTPTSALANFATPIKNEIDNTVGKIRYATYTVDKTKALTGDLDVLTITGTILGTAANGTYQITYGANTVVAATLEGQNVLIDKAAGSIVIADGLTASPSPTPSPSKSPSPSPTGTFDAFSSATPTVTATSTASGTGTSRATATSTATSTSRATATATSTSASTPTSNSTATATATSNLPVTGISFPFVLVSLVGFILIITSLLLVF